MERRAPLVLGAGALGMAGFLGGAAALAVGWLGTTAYLTMVTGSLAAYAASYAIGHLGDDSVARSVRRPSPGDAGHAGHHDDASREPSRGER